MKEISVSAASNYIYIQVLEDGFMHWDGISHPDLLNMVRKIVL